MVTEVLREILKPVENKGTLTMLRLFFSYLTYNNLLNTDYIEMVPSNGPILWGNIIAVKRLPRQKFHLQTSLYHVQSCFRVLDNEMWAELMHTSRHDL